MSEITSYVEKSFETYEVSNKQKIYLLQIFIKDSTIEMETCQQDSIVVTLSLTCYKCSLYSIVTEIKKRHCETHLPLTHFD